MSAWGNAWGFAWGSAWGLLQTPYVDLSGAEKVFVRELLSAIFVREEVEQIISTAATQQLSVLDAVQALATQDAETSLPVLHKETTRFLLDAKHRIVVSDSEFDTTFATDRTRALSVFNAIDHAVFVVDSADALTITEKE